MTAELPWERRLGAAPGTEGTTTRFRVWAPRAQSLSLRVGGRDLRLEDAGLGVFEARAEASGGEGYAFVVDGTTTRSATARMGTAREGRRREFAAFVELGEEIPDPQSPETFEASKLKRERDPELARLYEQLLEARRRMPQGEEP